MSRRTARRVRRQATASARRLQRLERTRRRGPLASGGTVLVVLVGAAVGAAAVTGRVELPPPPGVTFDLASSAGSTAAATDLVVRIENGSGDPDLTAEVARLARTVGIHGYEVDDQPAWTAQTRIVVHHDAPEVVAAAADLRDLIGAGVVERVAADDQTADLTVVLGVDARDPA